MRSRNHGANLLTLMEHILDESVWPHTCHRAALAFEPELTTEAAMNFHCVNQRKTWILLPVLQTDSKLTNKVWIIAQYCSFGWKLFDRNEIDLTRHRHNVEFGVMVISCSLIFNMCNQCILKNEILLTWFQQKKKKRRDIQMYF